MNKTNDPNKIYVDDKNFPYKTTTCPAIYTKSEIDGILAKYGVKLSAWNWEPELNNVYIIFKIKEKINDIPVEVDIRIDSYVVWNHGTRNKAETVNWNISMRTMYWFIKVLLEASYLKHSSKTSAFLPYIVGADQKTNFAETIIPRLSHLQETLALDDQRTAIKQPMKNITKDAMVIEA
jgi:hypothetical protein